MTPPASASRYHVVQGGEVIHQGDSAIAALEAFHEARTTGEKPLVITFDGSVLRGHSLHELEWDADAEKSVGDPTHYWPKAGERGPSLREVV